MRWLLRLALGLLMGGFLVAITSTLSAQAPVKFEKANITTVDGVNLAGYFYASTKKNPPTVLLLHALGEDSKKKNWPSLAEELQAKGYAVLAFDFRGHGNSTTISDPAKYYAIKSNNTHVKGKKGQEVEFKNILESYYTVFCNDVAAARAWLDRKNDSGACNTSNLILLGAESGATVGAIWLNSEWRRVKLNTVQMGFVQMQVPDTRQEGKDVIAAIWLSISSKLGAQNIRLDRVLDVPGRAYATPMVFMYGDGDKKGKDLAIPLAKAIKNAKDKDKYLYTDAVHVKGTNLTGRGLLSKELETDQAIVKYLNDVKDVKEQEWFERDYRKTEFVWMVPGGGGKWLPAKTKIASFDPNNVNFDLYQQFIPR